MRGRKIPFSIDRGDWRSLVEQLKDGLREAIVSGYYRPGDTLPSYRELAPLLDVSEIVTKAAIKQLAAEGLVSARPRIGTVVRDLGGIRQVALSHWPRRPFGVEGDDCALGEPSVRPLRQPGG